MHNKIIPEFKTHGTTSYFSHFCQEKICWICSDLISHFSSPLLGDISFFPTMSFTNIWERKSACLKIYPRDIDILLKPTIFLLLYPTYLCVKNIPSQYSTYLGQWHSYSELHHHPTSGIPTQCSIYTKRYSLSILHLP